MDSASKSIDVLLSVPTPVLCATDRRHRNGHLLTTLFEAAGSTRETLKGSLTPTARQALETRLRRLELKLDDYDEVAFGYLKAKRRAGHGYP